MMLEKLCRAAAGALLVMALTACGGGGGGGGTSSSGSGSSSGQTPANVAPSFVGATTFVFPENSQVEFVLTISDPDSDQVTITVQADGDAQLFDVDLYSGHVLGAINFDFENPQDENHDNIYEQVVTLSDGVNTVRSTIRVQITNVDEPPVFAPPVDPRLNTLTISVDENYTGPVWRVEAEDPEGVPVVYSIVAPPNQSVPNLFSVDATTGILTLNSPLDADESFEPLVNIGVRATAGAQFSTLSFRVDINDVPDMAAEGIRIEGAGEPNRYTPPVALGEYAKAIGDIDGDGLEEIWVTIKSGDQHAQSGGPAYLVWGKTLRDLVADGPATLLVTDLDQSQAIQFEQSGSTEEMERLLQAIPGGDIDGDGINDLVIGLQTIVPSAWIPASQASSVVAVIFGDALRTFDGPVYQVLSPPAGAQVDIRGLQIETFDLSLTTGDFDGDGREDIALGSAENGTARLVFGDAIAAARASGVFDMELAIAEETLLLRYRADNSRIQHVGAGIAGLQDLDGDGRDELLVAAENIGAYLEHGALLVSGAKLANAKSPGTPEFVIEGVSSAGQFIRIMNEIWDITTGGDVDHDGLADVIVQEVPNGIEDDFDVATLMFGSTLKSALQTGTDIVGKFSDPARGFNIEDPLPLGGGKVVATQVGFVPSFTGGPGDEVFLALPKYLGGQISILSDQVFLNATGSQLQASDGILFNGYVPYQRIDDNVFTSDFDGDGIPDLSIASPSATDRWIEDTQVHGTGGYFGIPGRVLVDAFNEGGRAYSIEQWVAVEGQGQAPELN